MCSQYYASTTSGHYHKFLETMLTGKGNLDEELLLPSKPVLGGAMWELGPLLSEQELLECNGNGFLTTLCTSVNWTGFNGESSVAVLSEYKNGQVCSLKQLTWLGPRWHRAYWAASMEGVCASLEWLGEWGIGWREAHGPFFLLQTTSLWPDYQK